MFMPRSIDDRAAESRRLRIEDSTGTRSAHDGLIDTVCGI